MAQPLDQDVVNLAKAIRQVETGNRPVSGASGELASRYQYMPATWKSTAAKYLGDPNAPLTLENENKASYLKILDWKKAGFGPDQIASMWNSGKPEWEGKVGVNKAGVKYDVPGYVKKVGSAYSKIKGVNTAQAAETNTIMTPSGGMSIRQTEDQASKEKYKSTFGANTESPNMLGEAAKTVGNIPSSAWNFVKGAIGMLNPVTAVNNLVSVFNNTKGLKTDLAAEKKSKEEAARLQNELVQQYKTNKATGKDTSKLEAFMRQNGIDPTKIAVAKKTPGTFGAIGSQVPGAVYEMIPESARALEMAAPGSPARIAARQTGNEEQVIDEGLQTAQRAIVNDPVGQIAPWLMGTRAIAGKLPGGGAAFNDAVSGLAQTVTKPVSALGRGAKETVTKSTKYGIGQATGLQPDTITQISKNPEAFTKGSRANIDRGSLGREIQSNLSQRASALKETGKEYNPIREFQQIDKNIAKNDTKVIQQGDRSIVYDLKEAPNAQLTIPELRRKLQLITEDTSGMYSKKDISAVTKMIEERAPVETVPHQVKVEPTYLENTIQTTTGLVMDESGQFKASGASKLRDAKDVRAIQTLFNTWKPEFSKGYLTADEFLNFRADLAKISKFERELTKSAPLEDLAKQMRAAFNDAHREQIPGLAQLDESFSAQISDFNRLKKGLVNKDGELTDAAINRIANATGKGKDALIARLEEVMPGITQKIKILKAVEDIEHASGIKVGTYGRAALGAGAFIAGGPITAIITAILTSPEVAVPLIRSYGLLKNSAAINRIVSGIKLGAAKVNALPAEAATQLKRDVTDIKLKGLSIEDVSKRPQPKAFSPKAKAETAGVSKPQKYYHGGRVVNNMGEVTGSVNKLKLQKPVPALEKTANIKIQPSISLSENGNLAKGYADGGGKVQEIYASPKKILDLTKNSDDAIQYHKINDKGRESDYGVDFVTTEDGYGFLKSKGYDAIKIKAKNEIGKGDDHEIRIFDDKLINKIEKPKTTLGKATDPLIQETKKYKSAEEFVESQPQIKNIGTNKPIDSIKPSQKGEDLFNDTSRGYAKGDIVENLYAANERPINVGKLKSPEQLPAIIVDDTGKILDGNHRWAAAKIVGLKEVKVITKSELTDIWNKANKKSNFGK